MGNHRWINLENRNACVTATNTLTRPLILHVAIPKHRPIQTLKGAKKELHTSPYAQ